MGKRVSKRSSVRSLGKLRASWVEIGGLGRLTVVGVVVALIVTLVLGFSITRAARLHLLEARATSVSAAVENLPPYPANSQGSPSQYAAFDTAVRTSVLGGETIRVKVWTPEGVIVYSDADELIGQQFELPTHAELAFQEGSETHISDLSDPAHAFDRGQGELIEFYVALTENPGQPVFVVEVEQDVSGLSSALTLIARNVWLSIGIGISSIVAVMALGVIARDRELNRRRTQAEKLLQSSFIAQEEERRRVVSALHDDIGQPLYRLLYGLEGSRAKLDPEDRVAVELGHLTTVVRDMDTTLRHELKLLHFEVAADVGLATALEDLAALTRTETSLDIDVTVDLDFDPSATNRTEIYRAAREALTNVRKHASASKVSVHIHADPYRVVLDVIDDGVGISDAKDPGLGLATTRQRFIALDGKVELHQIPEGGTRLRAWLPRGEDQDT